MKLHPAPIPGLPPGSSRKLARGPVLALLCSLLLCQSATAAESDDLPRPFRTNFAGSWEKDYNRSDKWDNELNRQIELMLRRQQNPQQPSGIRLGGARRSRPAEMVELARLAEFISRHNTLEIGQTEDEVIIERQGEAALICGTRLDAMQSFSSPYGSEICGWEQQQLIFRITLPEEIDIIQRFSVSSDGGWLNMLTSISRDGSEPFNLIQVFRRFDMPAAGEYNCRQTLGRGQICSARGTLDDE